MQTEEGVDGAQPIENMSDRTDEAENEDSRPSLDPRTMKHDTCIGRLSDNNPINSMHQVHQTNAIVQMPGGGTHALGQLNVTQPMQSYGHDNSSFGVPPLGVAEASIMSLAAANQASEILKESL